MAARLIKVIESTETMRGDGHATLLRQVTRYFDEGGQLLAEADPTLPVENGHVLMALQDAFKFVRAQDPDSDFGREHAADLMAAIKIMELRECAKPGPHEIPK